jgi:undecaprenyl diphosphate synthase
MKFNKLPEHVAITLDGNRRWADAHNIPRKLGIRYGIKKTEEIMYEWTARFEKEFGAKPFSELTIHALTLQNMGRPTEQIDELTDAFVETFSEARIGKKYQNVRVVFGGEKHLLREDLQLEMALLENASKEFTKYKFNVCIAYDGLSEIDRAVKLSKEFPYKDITAKDLMYFPEAKPIDLYIRTSGEKRLSNFMLYYIGYAEMFFVDSLAEDFTYDQFIEIMDEYANKRQRRFGK